MPITYTRLKRDVQSPEVKNAFLKRTATKSSCYPILLHAKLEALKLWKQSIINIIDTKLKNLSTYQEFIFNIPKRTPRNKREDIWASDKNWYNETETLLIDIGWKYAWLLADTLSITSSAIHPSWNVKQMILLLQQLATWHFIPNAFQLPPVAIACRNYLQNKSIRWRKTRNFSEWMKWNTDTCTIDRNISKLFNLWWIKEQWDWKRTLTSWLTNKEYDFIEYKLRKRAYQQNIPVRDYTAMIQSAAKQLNDRTHPTKYNTYLNNHKQEIQWLLSDIENKTGLHQE